MANSARLFSLTGEARGDGQVLRYKVSLGGNSYWFSVLVTKDRKIAQIYWW